MSVGLSIHKKLDEFELNIEIESDVKRIGILGASGCGKSMTLKSIAGIEKPDSGYVIVDGTTLFSSDKRVNLKPQVRSVGYLFQNYALFPTMTVAENIATGVQEKGKERAKRVASLIEDFRLQGLEKKLPHQLSGGQQQRVALARMMGPDPKVLLFDEPFSAMDSFLRKELRTELLEVLKKYDRTAILVTHDRDEAYQLCDWIVIMERGRVIASGYTKDMMDWSYEEMVSDGVK